MTTATTIQHGLEDHPQLDVLQAALDHINQGFSVFDADLRLLAWNRGLFEMLDLPMWLAARGTPLEYFFRVIAGRGEYGPGNIEEQVQRRLERAWLFEAHSFERVRPNGQVILVTGAPLPQGGFVTTYTDVTSERRQQEQLEQTVMERTRALRQSEDWLRLVTDNVPALVAYLAPGPVFGFANRAYARWFGQTVSSIVGRSVEEIAGPELYPVLAPHIERAFEGAAVSYEYSRASATGRIAHMRSTLIPDRTRDGRTLGCFVLSLDVTRQKHSEAALAQAQRMEAVGQLSGGLAHDFNNLLTIIIGNTLALKRRADEQALPDLSGHLDPLLHAARRGADLTRRLLAFARGDVSDQSRVRLATLVANVGRLLSGSLPKNVHLKLELSDQDTDALIDASGLENALINLAFNARDAMPEGGDVTLSLAARQLDGSEAKAFGIAEGAYGVITVGDTGSGMNAETLRRAFDPFFTTKAFGTGSGLGLPTVYGVVKRAGGHVEINSAPGEGTTITLYLPAAGSAAGVASIREETKAAPISDGAPEHIPFRLIQAERQEYAQDIDPEAISYRSGISARSESALVLVVDDEPDVAEVVRDQLVELGFSVLVSTDTEDALSLVRDVPEIVAVVSDVVMPGQLNGTALARKMREVRPDLPIALMSGYRSDRAGKDTREAGCSVLEKPFTSGMLANAMNEILDP
ncbi:PAS domain-containing protein [Stappia sp. GBMRC 2046]|uniref:histidine kinase n=1 Tax=Stappia sediminis TaxID=2692190 RepID=A0A7X3LUG6_9HYPH|nr:PAS-domain containing protein [Stappia sediminis]MXN65288.1 PAS domain-containing protein [Stappia sediminis]